MLEFQRQTRFFAIISPLLLVPVVEALASPAETEMPRIIRIEVYPPVLQMSGPRDRRQLVITGYDAAGHVRDVTHSARIGTIRPDQIRIDDAIVALIAEETEASARHRTEPPAPPHIAGKIPLPKLHATGKYSLASDFLSTLDSGSSWRYELPDGRPLAYYAERLSGGADDYPRGQPGWQASAQEPAPLIARSIGPAQSGTRHDLPESRVFGHAPLVVLWTAPHSGTVAVSGGLWMARDLDRRVTATLEVSRFGSREPLFRGVMIPERDGDNDGRDEGPNSSRPLSFAEAAHFNGQDPKRLANISLAEGDQVLLTVEGADFFGIDCDIHYTTPVPSDPVDVESIAQVTPDEKANPTLEEAALTVSVGGLETNVAVKWPQAGAVQPISFRYDVLPTLTRLGCNAGACHASPSGKGGFHLSLRGHDAVSDWEEIVYGENGRRINLASPEDSLLLRKPTMDVAHGGGHRMLEDNFAYRTLRDWIAQGSPAEENDAPACVRLEVYPQDRTLPKDARSQQLVALAHFSDGSVRDVTPMAAFLSSNEETATVDADGRVKGLRRGQSAVLVQYEAQNATAHFSWTEEVEDFVWSGPHENNYVDQLNFAQLREFQILPSELCSDGVFIRRLYLDLLGRLPEVEETEQFLSDESPDKRQRLVDAVLLRPEYASYWALRWADVLRVRNQSLTPSGVTAMHDWLVSTARENVHFDTFARMLLTAEGGTFHSPAANYYRALETPDDCAETSAELFLGVKIKCAKCHNHPYDRWTQDDYHGLAAFFSRIQRQTVEPPKQEGQSDKPVGDAEMLIQVAASGEAKHPRTGEPVRPWLPGVGTLDDISGDRRAKFADWLVQAGNPYFARVAVNRIWYQLFGRGLVHPIDDFRDSNPATNGPLLDALAADFAEHSFDQQHILRMILNSSTYQLSSQANRWNETDETFLSRTRPRRLTAEQLLDAICHVTEVPEQLGSLPKGTLATTMPSPDVSHPFLQSFGQPERKSACVCERSQEPDFAQALQMVNGDVVQQKLRAADNRFRRMFSAGSTTDEVLQSLYLAALCRRATDRELDIAQTHLASVADSARGIEDICWALLNTKEFLFRF